MNGYDLDPEAVLAVATCRTCGRGLRGKYTIRQDRPVYEHVPSGVAAHVRVTGRRAPRMVCGECAQAAGTGEEEGASEVRRWGRDRRVTRYPRRR
jgi:hypothetical protein